jgi:hypothetical protein
VFHQFHAATVVLPDLIRGMHGAAQIGQAAQFLLNQLQAFMALPVRYLREGSITLLTSVQLVLFADLRDLRPQTQDFFLQNLQMIHMVSIPISGRVGDRPGK